MKNSNTTPLRQKFVQFLTLRDLAERTVHAYTSYIIQLAKFHNKSPDLLTPEEVHSWFFHLISKRKYSASSVNIALNAVHSFYGKFLGLDCDPYLSGVKRPKRQPALPRVFSIEEIESLIGIGCKNDLRSKAFLSMVYGCGLRLSEATHVKTEDLCSPRHQLRVSHAKGNKPRYTLLSESLLEILRAYYHWVFTVPAILRPLFLQNQKLLYTLLFDSAANTLLEFGLKQFNAQLGLTALLHTWGQNLMNHPHLHWGTTVARSLFRRLVWLWLLPLTGWIFLPCPLPSSRWSLPPARSVEEWTSPVSDAPTLRASSPA